MRLAEHAEQYLKQEQRKRQRHDRPDHYGDIEASRRDAFQ